MFSKNPSRTLLIINENELSVRDTIAVACISSKMRVPFQIEPVIKQPDGVDADVIDDNFIVDSGSEGNE